MTIYQGKSTKKFTGGKLRREHSKRRYELGREPSFTRIGETERRSLRTMGGNRKLLLLKEQFANIYNPEDKTTKKLKILTVKENNADPHYVQRNIMNKGTIISTEEGNARITSRPGQSGIINAVLVK
ncbi:MULTISPECIES: 30S ribosomal protein S8e [Ferroplasma]|jgi:small subunit ribosomal protein S8e|uniref:Small ribosomal subunit protein eS8 n=2 Tax=Ferroplasma TaxID=74968 RepID=S0ATG4_FERAC|nr:MULTISPECIES: 30S ribosomal protein S8e [Ferroplasma]MCL4348660.1 30S ribosomal protein S8e [Candidatus Thermoplasmatota archaeon]AGO61390.1 30S ribosomal protein S8e [Ferroplasma acidarmanus Fer1]ARD84331.1 30S ribosomal protein S8e [Ferroplasma acidiphilum]NOL60194.1 30S ribosomal protein S8e [Ferroplasma acidiphilum]WMT53248.1 MAG: 30S ribosomal protein S8e [Ferroplasma acidiphilum]